METQVRGDLDTGEKDLYCTASQVAVPEHGLMCRDRVAAAASSICDFPICGSQIFEPKDLFVIVHGKTP